jgi:cell division transport system permease protein
VIMRLVGATDGYIVGPFALEGAIQGLIGATVSVAALYALHGALYLRIGGLLPVAMGQGELHFLPFPIVALLVLAGPLGGASVNTLATMRFLRHLS